MLCLLTIHDTIPVCRKHDVWHTTLVQTSMKPWSLAETSELTMVRFDILDLVVEPRIRIGEGLVCELVLDCCEKDGSI